MPTMSDDYYPDPDALYEERNELDYSWYDYIYREWDGDNPFEEEEEETE